MSEREDKRALIASRLEKLRTLDKLAEEMPGSRQGSGWDTSKIAETVVRVVPRHLDRLMSKAVKRGILQRITDSFRPASAMSKLAGLPTVIYFPLWHVRGYHECFYLRDATYQIRVDKDVVGVEVDGETRDLMIEEQEANIVPETFRRTLKKFSRLLAGERRYFNLDNATELALRYVRDEMYVTSDGREGHVLEELLPSAWKTQRVFDIADLDVEGTKVTISSSKESKETVVKRFQERLVKMPETSRQILSNTFHIEKLTQYYVPYVHFPVMRRGKLDHVIVGGASAEIADAKTATSAKDQLGI